MTTFHLPPNPGLQPHQERQSLKNQIVARAESIHAAAGGPPLYVDVIFHERQKFRKKDVKPFAHELADAILTQPVPKSIDEPMIAIPWGYRPKWTGGIQVHGSVDGVDKLWQADAGGWVAEITIEHVLGEIRRKASREPCARTRCDELWLVIANDILSLAAPSEISNEALNAVYEAPFERLIWLLPYVPKAIDLQLANQSNSRRMRQEPTV